MILNSPVFLAAVGLLSLLGILLIFRVFRTGLPGFDQLGFSAVRGKSEKAEESDLGGSQFKFVLLQTITIPIITLAILVGVLLYQINSLLTLNSWVRHSDKVLVAEGRVHTHIQETESSLRGYILTGADDYATQFLTAVNHTPKLLTDLKGLIRDNSSQVKNVNEILHLYEAWSQSALQAHSRRMRNQISLSSEINERMVLMEKIKDELHQFEAEEVKLKEERWASTQKASDTSIVLLVTLSLVAGLFLSMSGGHQLRRLSHSYSGMMTNIEAANRDLEQRIQDRTMELTATNKELEAFCYSVSHDLRAPLRGIDGFSQILSEEYQDKKIDENGAKYLEYIRQGVQKMGILIDDLLNLSRLTRIEINFKNFDISQMASEIFNALKATDPSRKVSFQVSEKHILEADPGLIRVALENLLSNALKYSSKTKDAKVEFGITETDHGTTYYVRDNGSGFDMKYYSKLFNVFQRLHDNSVYKGTGIGLATVKRVISRHGGEIWAESIPDVSTTFYFTLNRKAII